MTQGCPDILAPDRFDEFFKEFYWLQGPRLDQHGILIDLRMSNDFRCSFRTAAQNFRLIDETQQAPVIVAYREGAALIEMLERDKPERWLMRKLQRFVVNLPRYLHAKRLAEGALRELHPGIYVQGHGALYHEDLGFRPDKSIVYEPDELMC
jgi:CRISPR-associated endonuclease/helicase Cas3